MNSSPDLAARIAHLGHYFHSRGQADESVLPLRVRAFIALVGSRVLDAPYEWAAWVNWALEAGVAQDTIDAIREDRVPPALTAEEALIAQLCNQLLAGDHRLGDATFRGLLDRYGMQGIVELVVTLGYFAMIAMPLNAFEIAMSAEQKAQRKPFQPLEVKSEAYAPGDGPRSRLPPIGRGSFTPRLPLLAGTDQVPPEHQHLVDRIVRTRGWIAPVFQVLLHTPDVAERIASVGDFLLYESALRPETRALVGLIAAREFDCNYGWAACAAAAGMTHDKHALVGALEGTTPVPADDEALFSFCHALLRGNHHVREPAYEAALARFGRASTVQISVILGYHAMMALVANAFEIPFTTDHDRPLL